VWVVTAVAAVASAEPARVSLSTLGDAPRVEKFTASLRELISRQSVALEVRHIDAGEEPAFAAVQADFSLPTECTLTIIDAKGRIVLLRRLEQTDTADLLAEAAAHIVYGVVDELLNIPPPRQANVPPSMPPMLEAGLTPTPPAPEKPQGPWGLELGAFFAGRELGQISAGGGLEVSVTHRFGRFHPGLLLLGTYQAPLEIRDSFVTLQLQQVSPRLAVTLDLFHGRSARLDLGLGGGADVFLVSSWPTNLTQQNAPPRPPFVSPVLTGLATGRIAVARSVDVYLGITVDVDLRPPSFTEHRDIGTISVLDPWVVRPSLVIGFSFSALGAEPYAGRIGGGP
jgi:hypothetical protein